MVADFKYLCDNWQTCSVLTKKLSKRNPWIDSSGNVYSVIKCNKTHSYSIQYTPGFRCDSLTWSCMMYHGG